MKILVACEFSGEVRSAFSAMGHYAMSCDLLPTEIPGEHFTGDIDNIINCEWDMMLAFPPCTHLAVSGAAWFKEKIADGRQQQGIDFFMKMINANIPRIAVENPIGIMSRIYRKPDQIIHPWQFGHPEQKSTCLWLKGLPLLKPTNDVKKSMLELPRNKRERLHYLPPSENRARERSRTFQGIALAMAEQWGHLK